MLDAFWIGNIDDMPKEDSVWCEVWLRYQATDNGMLSIQNKNEAVRDLVDSCEELDIAIDDKEIIFPERLVKLIYANKLQLKSLIETCDYIAEFRRV